MYSLLIAEDEILERRMLEKIIQREYPMVDRILLAEHGLEALTLTRRHVPDILLVDINMPGMSGLELIHALRQEAFEGQIVIITAYDKFMYAQTAIDHGVLGYLLKPVHAAALQKVLGKCFGRIDRRDELDRQAHQTRQTLHKLTTYVRPQLMREMLSGIVPELALRTICGWPDEENLKCSVLWLRYAQDQPHDAAGEALGHVLAVFGHFFSLVSIWEGPNLFLLLQPLRAMEREQMNAALWLLVRKLSVSGSIPEGPQVYISQVTDTYEALRDTLARKTPFYPSSEEIPPALLPLQAAMDVKTRRARRKKAVMRLKERDAVRVLSLYSKLIGDPVHCWRGVHLLLDACVDCIEIDSLVDLLAQLTRANALKAIRSFLEDALGPPAAGAGDNASMDNALALMRTHFGSPSFSQSWLAEELGLSQAYFSRLFKKTTGTSFVAMLTEIRMECALELLEKGVDISATAFQCGYQSAKYFADTFRQFFGVSAHHYQKQLTEISEGISG